MQQLRSMYSCLFTAQKQKKHKIWHDGFFQYDAERKKGILLNEQKETIETYLHLIQQYFRLAITCQDR